MNIEVVLLRFLVSILPLFSIGYFFLSFKILKNRKYTKSTALSILLIVCGFNSLFYFAETHSSNIETITIFNNLFFLTTSFIPVIGFIFIRDMIGKKTPIYTIGILLFFSITLSALVFTNGIYHELIFHSIEFEVYNGYSIVKLERNLLYFLFPLYYLLFIIYSVFALYKSIKEESDYQNKKNKFAILRTFLIPLVGIIVNALYSDLKFSVVPFFIAIFILSLVIEEIRRGLVGTKLPMWFEKYYKIKKPAFLFFRNEIIAKNQKAKDLIGNIEIDEKLFINRIINSLASEKNFYVETKSKNLLWFEVEKETYDKKRGQVNYILNNVSEEKQKFDIATSFMDEFSDYVSVFALSNKVVLFTNKKMQNFYSSKGLKINTINKLISSRSSEEFNKIIHNVKKHKQITSIIYLQDEFKKEIRTLGTFWFDKWGKEEVVYSKFELVDDSLENKIKFEKSFFSNPASMFILDFNTYEFRDVNSAFLDKFKYKKEYLIDKNVTEINMVVDDNIFDDIEEEITKKGNIKEYKLFLKDRDGNMVPGILAAEVFEGQKGKSIIGTFIETSEIEKYEKMLSNTLSFTQKLLSSSDCEKEIPSVLEIMGKTFDACGIYVYENNNIEGAATTSKVFEWESIEKRKTSKKMDLKNIPIKDFENFFAKFKKNKTATFQYPKDKEVLDHPLVKQLNAKSIMAVPLYIKNNFWGFLAVHECIEEGRIWEKGEKKVLSIVGNSLELALERKINIEKIKEVEIQNDAIIESTPDDFLVFDKFGTVLDKRISHHNKKYLGKNTILDILPNGEGYEAKKIIAKVKQEEKEDHKQVIFSKDPFVCYDIVFVPFYKNNVLGIFRDISEKQKLQEELKEEKIKLETTIMSVKDGVISVDKDGKIYFLNKTAEEMLGITMQEANEKNIASIYKVYKDIDMYSPISVFDHNIGKNDDHSYILVSKYGKKYYIDQTISKVSKGRENYGLIVIFKDITEKEKERKKIQELSYSDPLTKVGNRRYFEEKTKEYDQNGKLPLGVIMVDVDGLKVTNDAFGHKEGDKMIIKTANILKKVANEKDIIARIGGDEFAYIIPNTNKREVQKIIRKLREEVKKHKIEKSIFSISMGQAIKEKSGESFQEIFKKAEETMYSKKVVDNADLKGKTVKIIMNSLFAKSQREMEHSKRVSMIASKIASSMSFSKSRIERIKTAGLVHDIGKIGISDNIIDKEGKLTDIEYADLKRHSEIGYRILSSAPEFADVSEFILQHHERPDGKGYPKGLRDSKISMEAKIISVADAFDAMTSDRSYRKGLDKEIALGEIKKYSGTQFDKKVTEAFEKYVYEEL